MDHLCFRSKDTLRGLLTRVMAAGLILTGALSEGCSLFLEEPPLFNAEQDGQLPVEEDAVPPFVPPPPLDARLELDRQVPDQSPMPLVDAQSSDAQPSDAQPSDAQPSDAQGSSSSDGETRDIPPNEDQRVDLG